MKIKTFAIVLFLLAIGFFIIQSNEVNYGYTKKYFVKLTSSRNDIENHALKIFRSNFIEEINIQFPSFQVRNIKFKFDDSLQVHGKERVIIQVFSARQLSKDEEGRVFNFVHNRILHPSD